MSKTKQKKIRTIFYRRVVWADGQSKKTLESHLKKAHKKLKTTEERTFAHTSGEIQGLSVQPLGSGLFFHVALYTPHQSISTVPHPSASKSKETKTKKPPTNSNFLEGDIFFLISGNHVVLCPSGARESIATAYIKSALRKSGKKKIANKYVIEPVAKIDKVKLIEREGVKKVSLNASLYEATVDYSERKTTKTTILNNVAEDFLAIFAKDKNPELRGIEDMENLTVRLEISFDSRKKGGEIGRKRLNKAANMLIHDDEDQGFSITTGNGKRLTANEIRISDKVKLSPHGSSVFKTDARDALETYLTELKESGMLEQ